MKKCLLLLSLLACSNLDSDKVQTNKQNQENKKDKFTIIDTIDFNDQEAFYEVEEEQNLRLLLEKVADKKINRSLNLIEENKNKFQQMKNSFLNNPPKEIEAFGIESVKKDIIVTLKDVVINIPLDKIDKTLENIEEHLNKVKENLIAANLKFKGIKIRLEKYMEFVLNIFKEKVDVFNTILSMERILSLTFVKEALPNFRDELLNYNLNITTTINQPILNLRESLINILFENLNTLLKTRIQVNKDKKITFGPISKDSKLDHWKIDRLELQIANNKILLGGQPIKLRKYIK